MSSGEKDLWNQFVDDLFGALDKCEETGAPARLTVSYGGPTMTIDIYRTKAQMKVFDEAVLSVAKKHREMDIVKGDP